MVKQLFANVLYLDNKLGLCVNVAVFCTVFCVSYRTVTSLKLYLKSTKSQDHRISDVNQWT